MLGGLEGALLADHAHHGDDRARIAAEQLEIIAELFRDARQHVRGGIAERPETVEPDAVLVACAAFEKNGLASPIASPSGRSGLSVAQFGAECAKRRLVPYAWPWLALGSCVGAARELRDRPMGPMVRPMVTEADGGRW